MKFYVNTVLKIKRITNKDIESYLIDLKVKRSLIHRRKLRSEVRYSYNHDGFEVNRISKSVGDNRFKSEDNGRETNFNLCKYNTDIGTHIKDTKYIFD